MNLSTGLQDSDGFWGALTSLGTTAIHDLSGTSTANANLQAQQYNANATSQLSLINQQNQQNNKALDMISNFFSFNKRDEKGNTQPNYMLYGGIALFFIVLLFIITKNKNS